MPVHSTSAQGYDISHFVGKWGIPIQSWELRSTCTISLTDGSTGCGDKLQFTKSTSLCVMRSRRFSPFLTFIFDITVKTWVKVIAKTNVGSPVSPYANAEQNDGSAWVPYPWSSARRTTGYRFCLRVCFVLPYLLSDLDSDIVCAEWIQCIKLLTNALQITFTAAYGQSVGSQSVNKSFVDGINHNWEKRGKQQTKYVHSSS